MTTPLAHLASLPDADALLALAGRLKLTSDEVVGWIAEHDGVDEGRARRHVGALPLVPEEVEGETLLRPEALDVATWTESSATRAASRTWYRHHVELAGPFSVGRGVADIARRMRGQNPAGIDAFAWMMPQRPMPLGRDEEVTVDGVTLTVPALDATRVLLDDDDQVYDQFSANDYLGLRVHPRVRAAAAVGALTYGNGSGGSRMLSGTTPLHRRLELALAGDKGAEDAVLFNTGYHANLAVMQAFGRRGGVVFSDERNHASMIDGLRLSGARAVVFAHDDAADLAKQVEAVVAADGPRALDDAFVAIEGIYSMDGDIASLGAILEVAERYELPLHLDEAHSALVLGEHGHGATEHAGVDPARIALQMGTLSKAFGGEGGYVALGRARAEALKFLARPFWFSTALSPAPVGGALAAREVAAAEPERRRRLHERSTRVREELAAMGYDTFGSQSWIVPVRTGDELRTVLLQHALRDAGILASAVFAPAVARGSERIRLSISSEHDDDQLDRLLGVFHALRPS